jgi:hypothetical protein
VVVADPLIETVDGHAMRGPSNLQEPGALSCEEMLRQLAVEGSSKRRVVAHTIARDATDRGLRHSYPSRLHAQVELMRHASDRVALG